MRSNSANTSGVDGFAESMQFGMICWGVPLSTFADTHNKQPLGVISLASQKSHMAVYLMALYMAPALRAWFEKAYAASGKKLDAGKSCVRFKALADLPLDVIGQGAGKLSVDALVALYQRNRA